MTAYIVHSLPLLMSAVQVTNLKLTCLEIRTGENFLKFGTSEQNLPQHKFPPEIIKYFHGIELGSIIFRLEQNFGGIFFDEKNISMNNLVSSSESSQASTARLWLLWQLWPAQPPFYSQVFFFSRLPKLRRLQLKVFFS